MDATIFLIIMQVYFALYCVITLKIINTDYNFYYTVINEIAAIPIIGEKIENILYHKNFEIFCVSFFVCLAVMTRPKLQMSIVTGYREEQGQERMPALNYS